MSAQPGIASSSAGASSGSPGTVDFYADARIYDILHGPGTLDDVRMLERVERIAARKHGTPRLRRDRIWLEPACGSGRYLRAAARRGRRVIGFDLEPRMIDFCRAAIVRMAPDDARRCGFHVGDMTDFAALVPKGGVDFAFNLINSIRHLPTDAAMLAHLRQMRAALKPGAAYVVGISLSHYGVETATEDVWSGSRAGTHVSQVVQYEPPIGPRGGSRAERVFSVVTVQSSRGERQFSSTYALRTYSRPQWERIVAKAGMRVAFIVDADGHDHDPGLLGYANWVLTAAT